MMKNKRVYQWLWLLQPSINPAEPPFGLHLVPHAAETAAVDQVPENELTVLMGAQRGMALLLAYILVKSSEERTVRAHLFHGMLRARL